ncbi:hypothetical protein CPT76_12970 [Paenibacillus sp. AR247]|jgi:hypothetical protein|nr:hypothetical protein CPT76_12970 [Paenibacillus sp. AR247]
MCWIEKSVDASVVAACCERKEDAKFLRSCSTMDKIIRKIEELRLELNKLSVCRCLTDPELIKASQKLDRALNDYDKFLKENM